MVFRVSIPPFWRSPSLEAAYNQERDQYLKEQEKPGPSRKAEEEAILQAIQQAQADQEKRKSGPDPEPAPN